MVPNIIVEDRASEVEIGTVHSRSFIEYRGGVWIVGDHESRMNEDRENERVTFIHKLIGGGEMLPLTSDALIVPLKLVEAKFTR